MKKTTQLFFVILLILGLGTSCQQPAPNVDSNKNNEFRAPAYPLVTIDPYTSVWSTSDQLFDSPVKHWTGTTQSFIGAIKVDGQVYRFLGKENIPLQPVIPNAKYEKWMGKYVFSAPEAGWENPDFNDSAWKNGSAAFGTEGMDQASTVWNTKEIWVRREFILPETESSTELFLIYSHDDDFELFLNGKEIVNTGNRAKSNVVLKLDNSILNTNGKNVVAAHCLDRGGLAYVDFGIFKENDEKEVFAQTAIQNSVEMTATQTKYNFTCGPVDLNLEFVSPLLPDDLNLLSRPVNYVNYNATSNDGKKHNVQIYFETTPEWAVNEISQEVSVSKGNTNGISYLKAGTTEQPILGKKGDNVRIDWGHFYMAAKPDQNTTVGIGDFITAKQDFISKEILSSGVDEVTAVMSKNMPVMFVANNLGEISTETKSGYLLLGYDDIESIQYFGDNLKAWWTQNGKVSFDEVLTAANSDRDEILSRCSDFDNKMVAEAQEKGGENYAKLCILAFRQSIAAHKLVKDTMGNILFLSKENFSNGSIGTVDVTYPSAPLYLKYNPELLKGMLNPIFYFSESGKWAKPFAAHDVGTYPQANGQTYGGDMPVEESGNMLILTTAIAEMEGNADYANQHWDVLTTWANYLLENGLDPENQLCTDDFAGHFAHNVNLSVKAIMGIAGYGKLAGMLGKTEVAEKYTSEAKRMAQEWMKMADDGAHFRLTFDQPGTWS